MQKLLPTLWSDGVPEKGVIVPLFQPVLPGALLVRPALREILDGLDGAINDSAVAYTRAKNTESHAQDRVHQFRKLGNIEDVGRLQARVWQGCLLRGFYACSNHKASPARRRADADLPQVRPDERDERSKPIISSGEKDNSDCCHMRCDLGIPLARSGN